MKWRCTWCGKPHAENDPPCDNCGHNKFEKAVVREGEDERERERTASGTDSGTVDTGTTYVWRCQNCGRDHVKNNPPCARCGNHTLEKTEQTYDDVDRDLDVPGWLEVAKPYAPVILVVAVVVALFATGIVPLSVLPGVGQPSPPDAPGEGSEVAGIDLEATEEEVHELLDADRGERSYDGGLAAFAEYHNRAYVAQEYGDGSPDGADLSDFDHDCSGRVAGGQLPVVVSIDEYDSQSALAEAIADALTANQEVTDDEFSSEGLDIHVVDESVYVFYVAC
ncbi:hypothetical protein [Natronolimnohabitans innermongolicus]|uniref:hypothetical protein n=1 Tax=Natronolimnohabitans innermongolicus TaxID=253107 RepID=UPI0006781365|nr:hypothetical protein [Natronolimnohabitans innermongolicus]